MIDEIADFISTPVQPANFPEHMLRFRNDRAATTVGLENLSDTQWVTHFGQFAPLPDAQPEPLALRYHGHQFRSYNPDLGDGRGFLFAQLRETDDVGGRLLDFGTKGSGQTPYSRTADGRLTLKGAVREALASEMLEALGATTSRTFSIIETGEALERGDEPSPTRAAVLVRLSHGHIRIGSFQRLFALGETDNLARLINYSLRHLLNQDQGDRPALALLREVVARAADLAASYMVAGFVHGVLNTDNIAITAESFDYGPWRFTPNWSPDFTAAYFDQTGLYAFGRQAEAIHWNLAQLAMTLQPFAQTDELIAELRKFPEAFETQMTARFLWRLGRHTDDAATARTLVTTCIDALKHSDVRIDDFFLDWRRSETIGPAYAGERWEAARQTLAMAPPITGALDHPYWQAKTPCSMPIDEVEAIWSAIDTADDWQAFQDKIAAIRHMGAALKP